MAQGGTRNNQLPAALGQAAASASLPVTLSNENVQDMFVTGQAAQTATVNNILTATAGAAATDLTGYRSGLTQILCPAGTYTTGAIIFEGSNDNVNFVAIPVWNQVNPGGATISSAITLVTTTFIGYTYPINFRYIQCRISTGVTGAGASVQAVSKFSQMSWTPPFNQVTQNTAGNLNVTTGGQTAHSSPSTGNPVRIGGRTKTTHDTTMADNDAANISTTTDNILVTYPNQVPELAWQYAAAASGISNTTTAVTVKAAVASIRNYVTGIQIVSTALGVATEFAIRDGAGGTVLWRITIPAAGILSVMDIEFSQPIRGTANTLLEIVTLTASVTGSVYANLQGFEAP